MNDQHNAEVPASEEIETGAEQAAENSDVPAPSEAPREPAITPEAQKIIAEKAFKEREAKREAEALRQQLAELQQQQQPVADEPKVPDYFDYSSDEEYQAAVQGYAAQVAERAAQDAAIQQQQQQQASMQALQQLQQAQTHQQAVQEYAGRAQGLGVTAEELQQSGNLVQSYGIRDDITQAIIADEDGPLLTKFLASNPQLIDELNQSTWQNGATVYAKVKQAAQALKPRTQSGAPTPPDLLQGSAPAPAKRGPHNATFD